MAQNQESARPDPVRMALPQIEELFREGGTEGNTPIEGLEGPIRSLGTINSATLEDQSRLRQARLLMEIGNEDNARFDVCTVRLARTMLARNVVHQIADTHEMSQLKRSVNSPYNSERTTLINELAAFYVSHPEHSDVGSSDLKYIHRFLQDCWNELIGHLTGQEAEEFFFSFDLDELKKALFNSRNFGFIQEVGIYSLVPSICHFVCEGLEFRYREEIEFCLWWDRWSDLGVEGFVFQTQPIRTAQEEDNSWVAWMDNSDDFAKDCVSILDICSFWRLPRQKKEYVAAAKTLLEFVLVLRRKLISSKAS